MTKTREHFVAQEYRTWLTAGIGTGKLPVRPADTKLPAVRPQPAIDALDAGDLLEEIEPAEF